MNEPILYAGMPRLPPAVMQLRSRKEVSTRDAVNARLFEEWQTDAPSLINNRMDLSGAKVLLDMNPIPSRTTVETYRQSQPFVANGPQLGMNPYFDRYDPTFDPRNAVRELRSAVYEDKGGERGIQETRHILERGFTSRWLPEGYSEVNQMTSLLSYETLRPQLNNMNSTYRKPNQK
jgi:hypothetical protein